MEQLPFIERNFHILNDDRFLMEKISLPIEIQDGEDIHAAINRTREIIVDNFKAAYPKVDKSLNFDTTIQVNPIKYTHSSEASKPTVQDKMWQGLKPDLPIYPDEKPLEKIEQKPIEQLIAECQTLTQLKEYELLSSMNKRYKTIYEEKMSTLSIGTKTEPQY